MDDLRDGLVPQWRDLYDAFVAAGHVPLTRRSGSGTALDDEWRDFDGRQVGIQCRTCGYGHRLGHARMLPIIPCDGVVGKARRLRASAVSAKRAWERAEADARQAEHDAGVLDDPLGYDTTDLMAAARLMSADALSGRNRDAVDAELARVRKRLWGDGPTLGDILRSHGIADAADARGWPDERLVDLALEILATITGRQAAQAAAALRLLSWRGGT